MSTQGVTITVNAESGAAAESLQRFFSNTIDGFDRLSGATRFLEELAGRIIAGLSVAAIVEFTREAINAAEAMGTLSRQVGFSLSSLSALKSAANINGIQFEELRLGLTHFNAVLNEARQNGGQAMQSFRNLSQEIAIAVAQGRPAEQIYRMIAERFKQMPDGIQKSAAAQAAFGRDSAKWVTLLNEGVEGLDKIKALNGGFTPETVANATEFNRSLREMHEQLELVFLNLATQILPTLQQIVGWLKQMAEQTDAVNNSTTGLVEVFKGLVTAGVVVGAVFLDLGKIIGYAVFGWVEVFQTAYEIIKQIISQIGSIYDDVVNLSADAVDSFITGQEAMAAAITGHFDKARSLIKTQISGIQEDVDTLADHMTVSFDGVTDKITKLVKDLGENTGTMFADIYSQWSKVSDFLGSLWTKPTAPKAKPGGAPGAPIPGGDSSTTMPGDREKIGAAWLQLQRDSIQLQQRQIETDPFLLQTDRLRQLLPLMIQERELIAQQIDQQTLIGNDETRTAIERIAAANELLKLQGQQLDLDRKIQQTAGNGNFWTQMTLGIKKLNDAWTNLGSAAAQTALATMQNGLDAVSQSISGVILGTKSWGQAWTDAMRQAVNGIVQMATQYVAAKLAMMAVDAAFTAKSTTQAATTTAASGTAGIAKAGEQGGWVGVLIYMGVFLAAMAAMEGIAAGVSGRATGGPVSAGTPYMVGERGPELIMPHSDGHVFTAAQTARIMNSRGGTSAAAANASSPTTKIAVNLFYDKNEITKHARDNPEFQHVMVDIMKRSSHIIAPRA